MVSSRSISRTVPKMLILCLALSGTNCFYTWLMVWQPQLSVISTNCNCWYPDKWGYEQQWMGTAWHFYSIWERWRSCQNLISFANCKPVTGSAISSKILSELQRVALDPNNSCAQDYDGAGSMSGHLNECQTKFTEFHAKAQYYHCANHQLNLALTKACSVKAIQCMLSDLKAFGMFLRYSPKEKHCLETCTSLINHGQKWNGKPEISNLKLK